MQWIKKYLLVITLLIFISNVSGSWVTPPNSVGADQTYLFNNYGSYYKVQNFFGDQYFYEDYNYMVDHDSLQVLFDDGRFTVEAKNKQGKWRQIDLYDKTLSYDDTNSDYLIINRTNTDGINILVETYIFTRSHPKIELNFTGDENTTYRILWKTSGINNDYIEKDLSTDGISNYEDFVDNTTYDYRFKKSTGKDLIINFADVKTYNRTTNITTTLLQQSEWEASTKKMTIIFKEFIGDIFIDPTWTTPSSVSSHSGQDGSYPAANTIDENTGTHWSETSSATTDWYITYNMGSSDEVQKIRIYADGNDGYGFPIVAGQPCTVTVLKVCNDAACSGESDLMTSDCVFSSTLEWQECDFADTTGQYIYVEGEVYAGSGFDSPTCGGSDRLGSSNLPGMFEFNAYLTGTPTDTCDCSGLNNDWEINMSDDCVIEDDCNMGTGKLSFTNTGNLYIDAVITTTDTSQSIDLATGQVIWIRDEGILYIG